MIQTSYDYGGWGWGFLIVCSRHTPKTPTLGGACVPWPPDTAPPTDLQDTWFWGRRVAPKAPTCAIVVEGPAI